jgi:hypothetical protein
MVERNIHCGVNILNELCEIKLNTEYNSENFDSLTKKLRHINHLKELGRASYHNILHMGVGFNEAQKQNVETHNIRIRVPKEREALFKQSESDFYQVHNCPCCGAASLGNFEKWENIEDGTIRVESAHCQLCTYFIKSAIGEPKEFGLMKEDIFVIVQ